MLLDVGNLRRSQLNNPVSQSSRPLGAVFKFWKVHFLKTALLETVQFVFGLGHHDGTKTGKSGENRLTPF